jgi:hypothetical protein
VKRMRTSRRVGGTHTPFPFSLADPDATAALLEASGFVDVTLAPVEAPMWMGSSVADAVAFMKTTEFATFLFSDVEATKRQRGGRLWRTRSHRISPRPVWNSAARRGWFPQGQADESLHPSWKT